MTKQIMEKLDLMEIEIKKLKMEISKNREVTQYGVDDLFEFHNKTHKMLKDLNEKIDNLQINIDSTNSKSIKNTSNQKAYRIIHKK